RLAGAADLAERVAEPGILEPEIDEAGACDLGARDLRRLGEPRRKLLGQLTRGAPLRRRASQRDVRRIVAVLGLRRPFELDRCAGERREPSLERSEGPSPQRPRGARTAPRAPAARARSP